MKMNDTEYKEKLAERLRKQYPMEDERTAAVNSQGLAAAGSIAILYAVGRMIYFGFRGELALPELILLFVMVIVIVAVQRQHGIFNLPRMFGKVLDPAVIGKKQRLKYYAGEAAIYAGSYSLLDYLTGITGWSRTVGGLLADFAIGFTVWLLGTYLINELRIRRYQQTAAALDAEENSAV